MDKKTKLGHQDAYNISLELQDLSKSKLIENLIFLIDPESGLILSFSYGYPTSNTAAASGTDASSTHLQNQNYMVCVRREKNYCYICWAAWNSITASASFGVSNPAADMSHSALGTNCVNDYVTVSMKRTFQRVLNVHVFAYRFRKGPLLLSLVLLLLLLLMIAFVEESFLPLMQTPHLPQFAVRFVRILLDCYDFSLFSIH